MAGRLIVAPAARAELTPGEATALSAFVSAGAIGLGTYIAIYEGNHATGSEKTAGITAGAALGGLGLVVAPSVGRMAGGTSGLGWIGLRLGTALLGLVVV